MQNFSLSESLKLFRIIRDNPLDSQRGKFCDLVDVVNRPNVNIEAGVPRPLKERPSGNLLLNVDGTRAQSLRRSERRIRSSAVSLGTEISSYRRQRVRRP